MNLKKIVSLLSLLTTLNFSIYSTVLADNLEDAMEAIKKQEYSTAIIHLKNQLKETPKNAQARFLLGSIYLSTGKLEDSIKELGKANQYAPQNVEIMFRYADVLQVAHKQNKIIQTLTSPLQDQQQESQRLNYLGYAHLSLKQLADAKPLFEQSVQLHKNTIAYNGLASLALIEQDLTEAEKLLSQAKAIEPDNHTTIQLLAKLANLNKQHEYALRLYNQLIETNKNNLSYRLERAATLTILNKNEQAKADLKIILDTVSNHPQANFIKAQLLLHEKDFAGAHEAALKVINVMPQHMPATLILGASNFALKRYNQAVEYLIIYLSSDPSNLKAQNILANVYLAQDKIRQTLLIMEGISPEQLQSDPTLLMTLGSAYIRNGENEKGIKLLNQAQLLAPDNQDIRKRLIAAQFQSGELDSAINELEQLASSQGGSAQTQSQTNYLLIISYIKQKQFAKANEKTAQLLLEKPNDTKLLNLKALIEQLSGNTEAALTQYKNILKQDKENIPAFMGLARIAATEQNWKKAEEYFKQVITINPNALKAYLGLAATAEKQNNSELAEKYILDAIEQSKTNLPSQLTVARLASQWYQGKKQPEKILVLAETLKKQHPNDNSVRSFLAQAQLLNQKTAQAERTLTSIITYDKKDLKHRVLLAQLINTNPDRSDEAIVLLDDALAIYPENKSLYTIKAAILINTSQFDKAQSIARTVQQQFPDSTTGKLLEADIYQAQKQYDKALNIYLQVYKSKPDQKILSASVRMYMLLDQKKQAITLLTEAVKTNPDDIDSLFKLASLHQEKQQLEEAEKYYQAILKKIPNHIISLNNLAWIHMEHNHSKAVKLAKKSHELAPDSPAITDTYGYALIKAGEYKQGFELLSLAIIALPEDNDIKYHLAYAHDKMGHPDKAMSILEQIVDAKVTFSEQKNARQLYQKLK